MLSQGDILKNKYRIIKKIGEGGMSIVWLAEDLDLNKPWAVKEINKNTAEYKRNIGEDGSLAEVEVLKSLDHPFAPRVTDIYETFETICVVMDYIEGESLQSLLTRLGPQSQDTVVSWMIDVCSLLQFLHSRHIIYRDIKPANIILTADGGIKVIDYGIAKIVRGRDYSDKAPLGTKGYASPEHFAKGTTELSDIYTVGITLYQLLTGISPAKKGFTIMPLQTINPELSSGLDEIVFKATRENPKERYQSASSLIAALKNYKRLEQPYILRLKKKIAISRLLLTVACVFISIGILGFEGLELKEIQEYNALISNGEFLGVEQEESLIEAIKLRPGVEDAYEKLLALYEDSLSEDRFEKLSDLYEDYYEPNKVFKTQKYCELNYKIAESIIANYDGISFSESRKRLSLAQGYLERVGPSDSQYSECANAYLLVLEFYEKYDAELSIPEDDAQSIALALKTLVYSQSQSFGKGTQRKQLAAYETALCFAINKIDLLRKTKAFSEIKALAKQIDYSLQNMTVGEDDIDLFEEVQSRLSILQGYL